MNQKPFHERVAQKLIEQLKQGTAPWQRPWEPGNPGGLIPINPITQKRYKGINALLLMTEKYTDTRWMTYKQATSVEAQVRKGEKGTVIQYWKFREEQPKKDEQGKPVLDTNGKPIKIEVRLERPKVFYATVFNAEQIEGLPPLTPKPFSWDSIERAEQILNASGAIILHGENNRAFYRPATDSIHLPDKSQFVSADNYYATALHELSHWSGHTSRMNRDLLHPFGSAGYAKEELRAEITSMILGDELGVGHDPGQHVSYIESWIKVLQDDPLELFRAAAEAEKMQEFILSFEQELEVTQDIKQTTSQEEFHEPNYALEKNPHTLEAGIAMLNELALKEQTIESKIWLDIPFQQKEIAKELAGKLPDGRKAIGWDKEKSRWFARPGADLEALKPWLINQTKDSSLVEEILIPPPIVSEKTWLAVPYAQKEAVKQIAGTLDDGNRAVAWDKVAKSWFAHPGANLEKLKPWLISPNKERQAPALTPEVEFSLALKSLGALVTGDHPIMDGKKHRISVEGDKKGEKSGFYVGHLDGHPAGYVKNNRTGIEIKWKSKGYSFTEEERTRMHAIAVAKIQVRAEEQKQEQEQTALRISKQLADLIPVTSTTPYLQRKEIGTHYGIFTDQESKTTYIPAVDVDGKIWTMQYIQEDGTKRFAKNSRKEGCFHVVGGLDRIDTAPAIVISEGYATAVSVSEAIGFASVCAFDAGNLESVARALQQKFPDKPFVIAGDDDKALELTQGMNPGKTKAREAANAVNGIAIFPIFDSGEQDINPKDFSDYNDLDTKSVLGREGVRVQVKRIVDTAIHRHKKGPVVQIKLSSLFKNQKMGVK